jgi:oxalate decarboxylase
VLIFDNGYFSEFGTFSVTDWIGHTPRRLLARNFGLPEASFEGFPTREVYFAHGETPPPPPPTPLRGWRDPPLTHKYRLLANPPRVNSRGGRFWLADSRNFPIAKTITGAILELDAGAMRELHWHPSADEWQYVFEGRVSVTMFGANGRFRTETLERGEVCYIPQGYGHSVENVGDGRCRILVGFNSGIYEDIDLSEWLASNPADVLATNFGRPEALFRRFPQRDVFIADRPAPRE